MRVRIHRLRGLAAPSGAPVVILLLAWTACGTPALLPPPEEPKRPVILSTTQHDRVVGEEEAEKVKVSMGLVEDPELNAYVSALGKSLVRFAPGAEFEYTFAIVDQDTPNAFALPGGYVFISRGLLALSNSEDELANVLSHEIVHVSRRHAAARQLSVEGVPGLLQWMQRGQLAAYGRDQEREADQRGQEVAAMAGYDPEGMATFLRRLEFTERLDLGATRIPNFLDTHPSTVGRAGDAAERARLIAWDRRPGRNPDSESYLRRLEGLIVGTPASEGVFQEERFLHPDLDFTLQFPKGWTTENTRQAVGAISPTRNSVVFLEFDSEGEDPAAAAEKFLAKATREGLRIERSYALQIGEKSAFRAYGRSSSPQGSSAVILTWIAHKGTIFRLTGATEGSVHGFEGIALTVARTFRSLTPQQRASIQETRLRIASARRGEDVVALSARTANVWNVEETAVMNGLFSTDELREGQLIKIAVGEPYRGKPSERPATAGG